MDNDYKNFAMFKKNYDEQIEKIQRKMDYFCYRNQNILNDDKFLEDMFLESILVDVRALLMENKRHKKNYTIQNNFSVNADNNEDSIYLKVINEIDSFVTESKLSDNETTFYEAVKFYTDKFIAHRDNITQEDVDKRAKIKADFVDDDGFSLVFTVRSIIEYAQSIERDIQIATLEEFTRVPEGIELEPMCDKESNYNQRDTQVDDMLVEEILSKADKDIDFLIGFDVRGITRSKFSDKELRKEIIKFISGMNDFDKIKYIIKVKETPNKV